MVQIDLERKVVLQSTHATRLSAQKAFAEQANMCRWLGHDVDIVPCGIVNLHEAPTKWLVDYDPEDANAHLLVLS